MARNLTFWIGLALIAGIGAGWAINIAIADPAQLARVTGWLDVVSDLFLRLIKMIIAPLVFATLVAGLANMGAGESIGRIGLRTMAWFLGASLVSLAIGMIAVNLMRPGDGLQLALPQEGGMPVSASDSSMETFITGIVPASVIDAMASNAILQIVVFSVFFGVGLASAGVRAAPVVTAIEVLAEVMLRVTGYVMRAAPFGVFAAIASVVATEGPDVLVTFGALIVQFYLALAALWLVLLLAALAVLGRQVAALARALRAPLLLAFSTASSEAAYPRMLEALVGIGVPRRIASFVLPLGYSFNLDGSMMYATFAILFIAQAYGIDLTIADQIVMLLVLLVASKGVAGVPRASLVVVAGVLVQFDLPEAGILLILGIDQILDMGRSATNVIGNGIATAVVAKWEGDITEGPAVVQRIATEQL